MKQEVFYISFVMIFGNQSAVLAEKVVEHEVRRGQKHRSTQFTPLPSVGSLSLLRQGRIQGIMKEKEECI